MMNAETLETDEENIRKIRRFTIKRLQIVTIDC